VTERAVAALAESYRQTIELSLYRIMATQPLLDFFPLGSDHDALPFDDARTFTILGHKVGALVQHLDEAVRFGPFECKRRKRSMFFFHSTLG
jgi:hypothetical protein